VLDAELDRLGVALGHLAEPDGLSFTVSGHELHATVAAGIPRKAGHDPFPPS
jgi:hypothetical protein